MQKVLPYSVVKRLPKKFFQDVAESTGVDWQQPVEVIELKRVQDVYGKVDKALEGKDLTDKQVILVYPTTNLSDVHFRKQCDMYTDKIELKFKCAWFVKPSEYEQTKHVRVVNYMNQSYSADSMSRYKDDVKTQNKFNKMYLLIVNTAEKRIYARTYRYDVFNGLERVNPSTVQGNFYRGLQGECQLMTFSTGYPALNTQHYDKWNFADLETCLDKSGYRFNPLDLQSRLKEYKQVKFTKSIGTGTPQTEIRRKLQVVLTHITELTLSYNKQVELNYSRNFEVFNKKLEQLTRIIHAYEKLNRQLTDQAHEVDDYYYMTHDQFAERINKLTKATQQAVGYTDESKPLTFIGV